MDIWIFITVLHILQRMQVGLINLCQDILLVSKKNLTLLNQSGWKRSRPYIYKIYPNSF